MGQSRPATTIEIALQLLQALDQVSQRDEELLRARELLIAFAQQRTPQSQPGVPDDFDEETYLALYPDVAEAVKAGVFGSGYDHWLTHGEKEGRIATYKTPPGIPADFDESGYLALNPDVAEDVRAGLYASGYEHWKRRGAKERRPTPRPGELVAGRGPLSDPSIPSTVKNEKYKEVSRPTASNASSSADSRATEISTGYNFDHVDLFGFLHQERPRYTASASSR